MCFAIALQHSIMAFGRLLHTQEGHRSSPCAPTIRINEIQTAWLTTYPSGRRSANQMQSNLQSWVPDRTKTNEDHRPTTRLSLRMQFVCCLPMRRRLACSREKVVKQSPRPVHIPTRIGGCDPRKGGSGRFALTDESLGCSAASCRGRFERRGTESFRPHPPRPCCVGVSGRRPFPSACPQTK
jgi:hypothetical protein